MNYSGVQRIIVWFALSALAAVAAYIMEKIKPENRGSKIGVIVYCMEWRKMLGVLWCVLLVPSVLFSAVTFLFGGLCGDAQSCSTEVLLPAIIYSLQAF